MPDTYIDSDDLARIAAWLDDCPPELREAWEARKGKPQTIAPPNMETLMAVDYAYVQAMKGFYQRQAELYGAAEKSERREIAMLNSGWCQSRGCTR